MHTHRLLLIAACLCAAIRPAVAFNPPEDTQRPLRVKIEGPAKVNATDSPIPVRILLENLSGDANADGTLTLKVIDTCTIEPKGPIPFELKPNNSIAIDATLSVGPGAYNGVYPLHAYVQGHCGQSGYTRELHAVLLIETQFPNPPRPDLPPIEWKPVPIQPNSECALLRLPYYRMAFQVFGESLTPLAPGWYGADARTSTYADPATQIGRPDTRDALLIHPPWNQGLVGTALFEYPLQLPNTTPIHLRFANALRDTFPPEPPSDGVTFRVRVAPFDSPDTDLGNVVYENHTDAKTWQNAEVDLSAFAGQSIRLQLESHPGPKKDTTCDASYWGAPQLIVGTPTPPSPDALGEPINLGDIRNGDDVYAAQWRPGPRGLLDGELAFVSPDENRLTARGFHVRIAGENAGDNQGLLAFNDFTQSAENGIVRVVHHLRKENLSFDLVGELQVKQQKGLCVQFRLENVPEPKPWSLLYIENIETGPWSEFARRIYAGVGNVLENPKAFELYFDGHQLAASVIGLDFENGFSLVHAVDVPPTKLKVNPDTRTYALQAPLNQTLGFFPAQNVWLAATAWRDLDSRPAAPGVKKLAGRFIFDLWGGRYANNAFELGRAAQYGLTDSVAIAHNWQRWGYDYRLPDIVPPNPDLGALEEFQILANTCRQNGILFAPHDNYIDIYPDAESFSYDRLAFTKDRYPVKAWLNEGRGAQAYRWRSDAYEPFMQKNIQWLRENVGPTAYFIDVFSSIGPYDSWTADGRFQDRLFTRDIWGNTFNWIRDQLGENAPQISESGHDQLVGFLDGAQCNHLRNESNPPKDASGFVWRVPCDDSERIPWIDMLLHDRFVLHGAGYESRFCGGLDTNLHGIYSDDYISIEVLDGHPAMVPIPFDRQVVRKYWLLHDLGRALALQTMKSVSFENDNIHQPCVEWANARVWVNRDPKTWNAANHELPQYGFFAAAGSVEAAIEKRDGVIVEWSRSPESRYVNARAFFSDRLPIAVTNTRVESDGGQTLRVAIQWHANAPATKNLMLFAHFVDAAGVIRFQADPQPAMPTNQWKGDIETISVTNAPKDLQPGESFELRVGMYLPNAGRFAIQGPCDNEQRVRLGALRFENGSPVWTPLPPQETTGERRDNPTAKPIDFGDIITNGGCRMSRDGDALVITPLPDCPAFSIQIKTSELPGNPQKFTQIVACAPDGKILKTSPIRFIGDDLLLETSPDVFAYRLIP